MNKVKNAGFTLVELMIVVAIIGILSSIAVPTYSDYVVRSNRSEALGAVVKFAGLQEQYYSDHRKYTDDMTKLGASEDPYVSENGYYNVDTTLSDGAFTIKATAIGTQATRDSKCASITLTDLGKKSGTSTDCWEK